MKIVKKQVCLDHPPFKYKYHINGSALRLLLKERLICINAKPTFRRKSIPY